MGHRFPATLGGATQGVSSGNLSASRHRHSGRPAEQAGPACLSPKQGLDSAVVSQVSEMEEMWIFTRETEAQRRAREWQGQHSGST